MLSKNIKIKIYRTIILPVVLYGREALSLILRDKHMLTVFKYRMIWNIFKTKRHKVTGEWKRIRNKEIHALYSSPNILVIK